MIRMVLVATIAFGLGSQPASAATSWKSGLQRWQCHGRSRAGGVRPLGLATGWAPWDSWNNMLSYMSSNVAPHAQG